MEVLLGFVLIYSVIHFFLIQAKAWDSRTQYEKTVSVVAMVGIILTFIGLMIGGE